MYRHTGKPRKALDKCPTCEQRIVRTHDGRIECGCSRILPNELEPREFRRLVGSVRQRLHAATVAIHETEAEIAARLAAPEGKEHKPTRLLLMTEKRMAAIESDVEGVHLDATVFLPEGGDAVPKARSRSVEPHEPPHVAGSDRRRAGGVKGEK